MWDNGLRSRTKRLICWVLERLRKLLLPAVSHRCEGGNLGVKIFEADVYRAIRMFRIFGKHS